MSGRHRKAFINLQSCLNDSSWIHLLLLIQLIQYKIEKTRLCSIFIFSALIMLIWHYENDMHVCNKYLTDITHILWILTSVYENIWKQHRKKWQWNTRCGVFSISVMARPMWARNIEKDDSTSERTLVWHLLCKCAAQLHLLWSSMY